MTNTEWVQRLQAEFDQSIPLTKAMGIRVVNYAGGGLELTAPLAPNINDKGTAFGGSISCLLTLAAWGVVWIECTRAGVACDIVIHKGSIVYHQPVYSELRANCEIPGDLELQQFMHRLERKGRARIGLQPKLMADGDIMALFDCQYVALLARET